MVVEDEYFIRAMIADEMRDCGFHVIECCTADEAIDVLNAGADVDVVFSDIRMPGSLDGAALASLVKEQFPDLTVILTSSESPMNGASAMRFIPKPYHPESVIKTITDLLQGTSDGRRR
jgi:two-component system, response regulator PdtaR